MNAISESKFHNKGKRINGPLVAICNRDTVLWSHDTICNKYNCYAVRLALLTFCQSVGAAELPLSLELIARS